MANEAASSCTFEFSVIIAVYDDWQPLRQCLQSLEQQAPNFGFEVILVDDGSKEAAPDLIRQFGQCYPLSIVHQSHAGIAAARNRGLQISRGSVLVFTDADCRFQANCLTALHAAIIEFPQYNCFQLHLAGDCSRVVGRAEELRLLTFQNRMLQPDGCIRYLNTAGFAIRRSRVDIEAGLFNPVALRAEDTLLLAGLMQSGELPFFVPNAMVHHSVSLSIMECFRKDVRSAWLEGKAYEIIAAKGVPIRMSQKERFGMLLCMWRAARQHSIGRAGWLVLVARQSLKRIVSLSYRCLHLAVNTHASEHIS